MKTDKSRKVGSCSKSKGPAATKRSVAKKPRGKAITHTRGQSGYHGR